MAQPLRFLLLIAALCAAFSAATASAELVRITLHDRQPFAGGKSFGNVGEYDYWTGRAEFAIDPKAAVNLAIVDLKYAPLAADGRVLFSCDVAILAPRDPQKGNGVLLHEINNRGNKLALSFFNEAAASNSPRDAGNEHLFRHGYSLLWCGWIAELKPGSNRLLLSPPSKSERGNAITGLVRYEWTPEVEGRIVAIAGQHHGAYPPTENGLKGSTLTWRLRPQDPRVPIPREQYQLRTMPIHDASEGLLPTVEVELPAGFQKGYLYELIYEAEDPFVSGVGFAAVRDLTTAMKHHEGAGWPMPLAKRTFSHAIGFGVSQSGRFLREFLYSGFNADERDRRVFDGLIPHVAGAGMGSFNQRFAQPTTFATPFQKADWAVDLFPFGYHTEQDRLSGKEDGILLKVKSEHQPKILHTQSSTEYWSRGGSLVHTNATGTEDAVIPENVRIYTFGGTQHGPATYPPGLGDAQTMANPADYRPILRALLEAMTNWMVNNKVPPSSRYPSLDRKELGSLKATRDSFPIIPAIRLPEYFLTPKLFDQGPRWEDQRIIDIMPPSPKAAYGALTPLTNSDGVDVGCINPPEVTVGFATYTGWSLRSRDAGAQNQLVGLAGSYIPFPATRAERLERGDPRPSIEERYRSVDDYLNKLQSECERMAAQGYLLNEDVPAIIERHRERAEMHFQKIREME